jgi:hypothetical protein
MCEEAQLAAQKAGCGGERLSAGARRARGLAAGAPSKAESSSWKSSANQSRRGPSPEAPLPCCLLLSDASERTCR